MLARAHWRLDADETANLGRLQGATLFEAVHRWREQRGIPRHVRLADDDNELLPDFDNVLSVESFAQLIKGRDAARLAEAFPGPDDLCVTGPDGRYFHELSIPFLRTADSLATARPELAESASADSSASNGGLSFARVHRARGRAKGVAVLPQRATPGSDWLFARLYTGPAMIDSLLRRVVRPLVDRALGSGAADGWFFVRYSDPEWHLRLRFHGAPARPHAEVLPLLSDAVGSLLESGQVRRLTLDTYERLFQADSMPRWRSSRRSTTWRSPMPAGSWR